MGGDAQSSILYVMVFCCAFLGLQVILGAGREIKRRVHHANDRQKQQSKSSNPEDLLSKMRHDRGLNRDGYLRGLNYNISKTVLQSGLPIGPYAIYPITLLCGLFGAIGVYLLTKDIPKTSIAFAIGFALPVLIVRYSVKKRREKAAKQLPEALEVIIRSLRAGHPVSVALALVGLEMPDPIGSEFGMASDEIGFGGTISDAIQRLADRVGQDDFDLFAAMIRLQEKTGGNLAELLQSNSETIRARQRMRLKIKAASSEGRASALILNAAPIGLFFMINLTAPDFYGDVPDRELLNYTFGGIIVWMTIGNLVMRKMINFKI